MFERAISPSSPSSPSPPLARSVPAAIFKLQRPVVAEDVKKILREPCAPTTPPHVTDPSRVLHLTSSSPSC